MLKKTDKGFIISIYVQPNGKKNEILGLHDGYLKVRIKAPPIEGQANAALENFISDIFNCAKKSVSLVRGDQSRKKIIEVIGVSLKDAQTLLKKYY